MCQPIVDFCTSSTKLLLYIGSFLTLLLAISIAYTACNTNSLYVDLDPQIAETNSLSYYLQLLASIYLIIITILSFLTTYYDQKHSIRALAILTTLNFILAVAAILVVPSGTEIAPLFGKRLDEAKSLYDFTDKPKLKAAILDGFGNDGVVMSSNATTTTTNTNDGINLDGKRTTRDAAAAAAAAAAAGNNTNKLDQATATKLWDSLQNRGCCGFKNTTDWSITKIPKSCCLQPIENDKLFTCKEIDLAHNRPCIELIGSKSLNLLIILGLIALVNLYLATIFGLNTYRTFHYSEASQNAYT